jgi:hypothetical protein
MNSDISEPTLASWVRELQGGRNGQFAESLKKILAVPWHWQSGYDNRPEFYHPAGMADVMITMTSALPP